jgi:hypothetical protein
MMKLRFEPREEFGLTSSGKLVEKLIQPCFVSPADGNFELHDQAFAFGPLELQGLKIFLREPKKLPLSSGAA